MPFGQQDAPNLGIYGGSQPAGGGMMNPMGTFGAMMNIQEQQALLRERQLQAQKQQQDIDDDNAIRAMSQSGQYSRPDDMIDALYKTNPRAAAKFGSAVYNQRKAQADDEEKQTKGALDAFNFSGQLAKSATDDASWQNIRPAIVQSLGRYYPNINQSLPTTYDKAKIDQLVTAGTSRAEQINKDHLAQTMLTQAYKDGAIANPFADGGPLAQPGIQAGSPWSDEALKAQDHWAQIARQFLPQATDEADWYRRVGMLHDRGMPDSVALSLPKYDPDNPSKTMADLQNLTLTGEQAANVQHQKAEELAKGIDQDLARDRLNYEQGKTTTAQKPMTANELANLRSKRAAAFDKSDAMVRLPTNKITVSGDPNAPPTPPATGWRSYLPGAATTATPSQYQQNLQKATANAGDYPGKTPFWDLVKPAAREQYVNMRVNAENAYREATGAPTMEEAAEQAVANGDQQAYFTIAQKYKAITNGLQSIDAVVPWREGGVVKSGTASSKDVALPSDTPAAPPKSSPPTSRPAPAPAPTGARPASKEERDSQVLNLQAQLKNTTDPRLTGKLRAEIMRLRALSYPGQ